MKELVSYIARSLVDHPDAVEVIESGDNLTLRVAEDDVGKVIGRQGRTARAIRTLLIAASTKARRRVMLEITE